jgi:KDO2-lipid IV(A) lauroyltransferase
MRARDFIDFPVYVVAIALMRLFSVLPEKVAAGSGSLLGRIYFVLGRRRREMVLGNMRAAFAGEKTEEEILDIARAFYRNMGLFIMEFARLPRLDRAYVDKFIKIEGRQNFERAFEKGRGLVFLTAHFGNWELLSTSFAVLGHGVTVIVRPLDNKYLNAYLEGIRSKFGTTVISKKEALKKMLEEVRGGRLMGILLDQRASRTEGISVDFFGRPALTSKGLAAVAVKTGVPVLPIFIVREGRFSHRIICDSPVEVVTTGDREHDIRENTQRFTAVIERFIRAHPDQWFWFHSRWERRKRRAHG